jgi:hypothetical protein
MNKWLIGICLVLLSFGIVYADTTVTTLTFLWDSNIEDDLAGYGFYVSLLPGPPYDLYEDGIPPSETETVSLTIENVVVNINTPTYFSVDAYDESGNRSGFSIPVEYVHCVPLANETQTLSCPTGQTGSIIQTRTSSCSFNSMPIWTAWVQTSNTCKVISNCTPTTQTRTIKCDKWYYKGSTTQKRTSICNADGTITWGAWTTVSSTCRPWYSK